MNRIYITVFLLGLFLNLTSCKENRGQSKKNGHSEQVLPQKNTLEYQIRMPSPKAEAPIPLMLLMHGYGSNEMDMANLAKSLDPRAMILSVQAPYKIGENKYSWYQLDLNGGDRVYSYEELQDSRAKLINLIRVMQSEHNIDKDNIIVGGFSQGAIMSLALSLNHSDIIDGAMVLSGDLLDEVEEEIKDKQIDKGLDIYMSHGRQDRVLSFAEAVKDIKLLKSRGIDIYEHYYDSAHTISRDNFLTLSHWLSAKIDD